MSTEPETPVIFRKFIKGGAIIALFPTLPGDSSPNTCSSYMHVGQHGAAHASVNVSSTVPASLEEYDALRTELESEPYCYRLRVYRRWQYRFDDARRDALKEHQTTTADIVRRSWREISDGTQTRAATLARAPAIPGSRMFEAGMSERGVRRRLTECRCILAENATDITLLHYAEQQLTWAIAEAAKSVDPDTLTAAKNLLAKITTAAKALA